MEELRKQCQSAFPETDPANGTLFCAPVVDNLLRCWPRTPAGRSCTLPCRDVLRREMANLGARDLDRLDVPEHAVAFRECNSTGEWAHGNWTNYSLCMAPLEQLELAEDDIYRVTLTYVTFIGSLVSLLFLAVALFVFCYFRCLQCSRLSVHKNLVASLMLCNIVMIIFSEPFVTNRTGPSYRDVEWLCKGIIALQMYGRLSSVMWMWNEGFFLHSRITISIFDSTAPFKFLHLVGWGLPAAFVVVWSVMTERALPWYCWKGYAYLLHVWFIIGPMITALGINLLFLINILRILITRLQNNTTMEIETIRKAIKATAVLFPLLGITNLFFFIRPSDNNAGYPAYLITNSVLHSAQGIFVSILYCFLNSEVRLAVKKRYYRLMAARGSQRWLHDGYSRRTSSVLAPHTERRSSRAGRPSAGQRCGLVPLRQPQLVKGEAQWRSVHGQRETEV